MAAATIIGAAVGSGAGSTNCDEKLVVPSMPWATTVSDPSLPDALALADSLRPGSAVVLAIVHAHVVFIAV